MNYSDFKKIYFPITNSIFPLAEFEGTLFSKQDFSQIMGYLRHKKLWSLVENVEILDVIENKTKIVQKILPGVQPNAIGYFVTSVPYDKTFLIVNNLPIID